MKLKAAYPGDTVVALFRANKFWPIGLSINSHMALPDVIGNLLSAVVHTANIHDTKSGIFAAKKAIQKYPSIQRFCADADYRNSFEKDVESQLKRGVDISTRIKSDWEIIPKRWVVERTSS